MIIVSKLLLSWFWFCVLFLVLVCHVIPFAMCLVNCSQVFLISHTHLLSWLPVYISPVSFSLCVVVVVMCALVVSCPWSCPEVLVLSLALDYLFVQLNSVLAFGFCFLLLCRIVTPSSFKNKKTKKKISTVIKPRDNQRFLECLQREFFYSSIP